MSVNLIVNSSALFRTREVYFINSNIPPKFGSQFDEKLICKQSSLTSSNYNLLFNEKGIVKPQIRSPKTHFVNNSLPRGVDYPAKLCR